MSPESREAQRWGLRSIHSLETGGGVLTFATNYGEICLCVDREVAELAARSTEIDPEEDALVYLKPSEARELADRLLALAKQLAPSGDPLSSFEERLTVQETRVNGLFEAELSMRRRLATIEGEYLPRDGGALDELRARSHRGSA